jgi:ABC-type spermidine/putrescine transport system permease subunit II
MEAAQLIAMARRKRRRRRRQQKQKVRRKMFLTPRLSPAVLMSIEMLRWYKRFWTNRQRKMHLNCP